MRRPPVVEQTPEIDAQTEVGGCLLMYRLEPHVRTSPGSMFFIASGLKGNIGTLVGVGTLFKTFFFKKLGTVSSIQSETKREPPFFGGVSGNGNHRNHKNMLVELFRRTTHHFKTLSGGCLVLRVPCFCCCLNTVIG